MHLIKENIGIVIETKHRQTWCTNVLDTRWFALIEYIYKYIVKRVNSVRVKSKSVIVCGDIMSGRKTTLLLYVVEVKWQHICYSHLNIQVISITFQLILKHRVPSLPIVCFYKYNNFPSNKVHTFYFVWVYDINTVYINISMN